MADHVCAAIGVAGHDRRAILEIQHLSQPGDVIGYRGHRELGCYDVVAVGLQALDDGAPARAVRPCTMDKDDIRSVVMSVVPFLVQLKVTPLTSMAIETGARTGDPSGLRT